MMENQFSQNDFGKWDFSSPFIWNVATAELLDLQIFCQNFVNPISFPECMIIDYLTLESIQISTPTMKTWVFFTIL